MHIRPYREPDEDAVVALWQDCGLTRPWNDPRKDIARKLTEQRELFLVGELEGRVVASVMAGYEGHRGWVNYLAVAPEVRGRGFAGRLMQLIEARLMEMGCPKVNLLVRSGNTAVLDFYRRLGYSVDEAVSLGKRLIPDAPQATTGPATARRDASGTEAVVIRPLLPADQADWLVLWGGYNAFYGRSGPTALPDAITQATWARFFDPAELVHALVAASGGRVVGLVHYLFHRSTSRAHDVCYLQDLFTQPERRGQGIGRQLVEAVYEAARRAGSSRVYWHTQAGNQAGRALYDQVAQHQGFIVYTHEL